MPYLSSNHYNPYLTTPITPGIENPEDLFSLQIPHPKESLATQWRPEIMETPIFRRLVNSDICNSTPWAFSDFNYSIKCLGCLSRYHQELSRRRGVVNAVGCKDIPGEVRRYCFLLIQPSPTGYGRSEELDNGTPKS